MYKKCIIICFCVFIMAGCNYILDLTDRTNEARSAPSISPITDLHDESSDIDELLKDSNVDKVVNVASQYEQEELVENDFEVNYKDMLITSSSTPYDFENFLGYPEGYYDNNYGNVSNGNGFRRWKLKYPDYNNSDISIMFLSKQEIDENGEEYHGDTYLVGIYLDSIKTDRGLKVGDPTSDVFELYGKPTLIQRYDANINHIKIIYTKDENKLIIILDETNSKVMYIFIDYRMEQSIKDQGIDQ